MDRNRISVLQSSLQQMDRFSSLLLKRIRFYEYYSGWVTPIQLQYAALEGSLNAYQKAQHFFTRTTTEILLYMMITQLLGVLIRDYMYMSLIGGSLAAFTIIRKIRNLQQQVKSRSRQIIIELPELLNKIILLVNAGETVQQAICRCAEGGSEGTSPLYRELAHTANSLKNNESFQLSLEAFSKRCAVQEVAALSSVVLLNYRRGGNEFIIALRGLAGTLWEKRKALTKIMGEEASTKLIFPMVMIFFIVMVIVAAPAILWMNQS